MHVLGNVAAAGCGAEQMLRCTAGEHEQGLRIWFPSTSDVSWMWGIESSCVVCSVRVEVCESGLVAMAADVNVNVNVKMHLCMHSCIKHKS